MHVRRVYGIAKDTARQCLECEEGGDGAEHDHGEVGAELAGGAGRGARG